MKAPINYPCVMLERKDTTGINCSEENLTKKFSLIEDEKEFSIRLSNFEDPVICHYHTVIREAIRLNNLIQQPAENNTAEPKI